MVNLQPYSPHDKQETLAQRCWHSIEPMLGERDWNAVWSVVQNIIKLSTIAWIILLNFFSIVKGDLSPLYGMNNYVLIWDDWLSCDPLGGSHDSQSPHIRKHLCPILWQLWFICHKSYYIWQMTCVGPTDKSFTGIDMICMWNRNNGVRGAVYIRKYGYICWQHWISGMTTPLTRSILYN